MGGAGFGPAKLRDKELVIRDYEEGLLSKERAREVYGVVVD
jgi:N-methylhydantoinase B/oxoprolinase/acetone carboxylase alpha subunit